MYTIYSWPYTLIGKLYLHFVKKEKHDMTTKQQTVDTTIPNIDHSIQRSTLTLQFYQTAI